MSSGHELPTDFLQDGKDTSDPNKALLCLKKRYEAGGRSVPFLYTFGTSPALTQRAVLYDQVSANYLKTQTAAELASRINLEFIFNTYGSFGAPTTQYLLVHQQVFMPQLGQAKVNAKSRPTTNNVAVELGGKNDLLGLGQL